MLGLWREDENSGQKFSRVPEKINDVIEECRLEKEYYLALIFYIEDSKLL